MSRLLWFATFVALVQGNLSPIPEEKQRIGNLKGLLVVATYNELEESAIDKELLRKRFDEQPGNYFKWASNGKLDLSFDFVYVSLGVEEKNTAGECRRHPGADYTSVANVDDYTVWGYVVLTTKGCGGPCAYGGEGMECTWMYDQLQKECPYEDSTTRLCQKTFVHEMLHGLGLGYHQGGFKCTRELILKDESWRNCPYEEYGGVLDSLEVQTRKHRRALLQSRALILGGSCLVMI